MTMRENIRMGNPQASDADIEEAAKAAEIHEFISSLPRGYDTRAGDRGNSLSGGQRQRMAIARAILRNPAILILDEATSALDPASEAAINETLRRLARSRTVIAVTHRLRAVKRADHTFVLHNGRIVEQGKHQELLDIRACTISYGRLSRLRRHASRPGALLHKLLLTCCLTTIYQSRTS